MYVERRISLLLKSTTMTGAFPSSVATESSTQVKVRTEIQRRPERLRDWPDWRGRQKDKQTHAELNIIET